MRICLLIGLSTGYFVATAQSPVWKEMSQKYPGESALFLERDKVITLEVRGDSVVANATMTERILFLKDRPDNTTDMRIYGSHFQEIEDLKAATLVWDRNKYKDIPLSGLTRQQDSDESVFFDDSYFYHLSFPSSHAGNQAVWSYREKYRDARFISAYYFQDYLTQLHGSLLLKVPLNVELNWQILNDEEKRIQFKQFEKGGYKNYEWTVENMPAVKREERSPKYAYFVPHLVINVSAIREASRTVRILSDLGDLHKWYAETLNKTVEEPSPELTQIANSLVSPGDNEIDIVQKVFYWVQDNIRYVAFEDGMRGLVPHKPSYVLEKRYGDCKDMASLINGMLKSLGIPSYYTWIGTRDIPYRYSKLPSPLVDNHMIATYVDKEGKYYFLDGTSNYTSINLPSAMIQGKEAFIAIDDTRYEVKTVPEIPSLVSQQVDTVRLSLKGESLLGRGKVRYYGYQKIDASYDFNKTVLARQKDYVTTWLQKGSNKFILDNYVITDLKEKDKPLTVAYDFHIDDYVTYVDKEIYINLNLVKIYHNQLIISERKAPMKMDYKFSAGNTYFLEIPEGYELEYIPPDAQINNGLLKYVITYDHAATSVRVNIQFENNVLMLTEDQFPLWNQAITDLSSSYKESIILKKKTS